MIQFFTLILLSITMLCSSPSEAFASLPKDLDALPLHDPILYVQARTYGHGIDLPALEKSMGQSLCITEGTGEQCITAGKITTQKDFSKDVQFLANGLSVIGKVDFSYLITAQAPKNASQAALVRQVLSALTALETDRYEEGGILSISAASLVYGDMQIVFREEKEGLRILIGFPYVMVDY